MREQYMRNGEGFILCYSITDRRSFEEVLAHKNLIDRVRCNDDTPIIITGNKCDLEHRRKVCKHFLKFHNVTLAFLVFYVANVDVFHSPWPVFALVLSVNSRL